jgi:hypothetical protein
MKGEDFKNTVQTAKAAYFATADAVLAKNGLTDTSAEGLRKLLANSKKSGKNKTKKAAS